MSQQTNQINMSRPALSETDVCQLKAAVLRSIEQSTANSLRHRVQVACDVFKYINNYNNGIGSINKSVIYDESEEQPD